MAADILTVVETHWREPEHKSKRITLHRQREWNLCATAHRAEHRQKGVAIILSRRARSYKVAESAAQSAQGEELGTALRVTLALAGGRLQVIAVYRPPGQPNADIREATDNCVLGWLNEAQSRREEVVVMGDLNTDLWSEREQLEQIVMRLRGRAYADAWRTIHGDRPCLTYPHREPRRTLDYILVSANLQEKIRQVSLLTGQSELNEDHCQLWMEMGGLERVRGPPTRPASTRPRIATGLASKAQWEAFAADVDTKLEDDPTQNLETVVMTSAQTILPHKRIARERTRVAMVLHKASAIGKRLGHIVRKGAAHRARWHLAVTEAVQLLKQGLPDQLLEECERMARGEVDGDWTKRAKALTTRITRKLQELVRVDAERQNARQIADAVKRRMDQFEFEPGQILRKLRRGRRYAVLDRVVHRNSGTGAVFVFNTADEVEARASQHFANHFTGNLQQPIALTGEWRSEYAQRYDMGLDDVTRPIEEAEWEKNVAESPRGKAPGRSGMDFEMVRKLGPEGQDRLRDMCNRALETGVLPTGWTSANLIPIPKKPTTDGELDQYRPIALLEVGRKLLTRILTVRMTAAIAEKGGLQGLNVGFQPNKRATDLGFAQQRWAELMRIRGRPVEILLLDVAKAYDSVSWELLEMSLRRVGAPEALITLLRALHSDRQIYICTAFGRPVPFTQQSGLSQGDSLSPLAWLLVYDTLLTVINRQFPLTAGTNGQQIGMAAAAMADDLSLMGDSREQLQEIADAVSKWFNMVGVRVNATKTEHLSHGQAARQLQPLIWQGHAGPVEINQCPPANQPVRILGQRIVTDGSTGLVRSEAKDFVAELVGGLERRRLTDRICQLYAKAVLMPAIEYRLLGQPLLQEELEEIARPIYRWVKHGFGLPSTSPSSVVHHRHIANLPRLTARMAARSADLLTRFYNGEGAQQFARVAEILEGDMSRLLRFPGNVVGNGRLMSSHRARARTGIGRLWIAVATRMLARYNIEVGKPTTLRAREKGVLASLRHRTADDIITSLYNQGQTEIGQVYDIWPGGSVRVREGGAPHHSGIGHNRAAGSDTRWRAGIRKELERVRKGEVSKADSWIDTDTVQQTLYDNGQPDHREQFRPQNIRNSLSTRELDEALRTASRVVAHTDGSLEEREQGMSLGFGARIQVYQPESEQPEDFDFSGGCQEGPFSSTMAEVMAVIMALALVPAQIPLHVRSDSQAAIGAIRGLQRKDPKKPWRKSSMALLLEWSQHWFRRHWDRLTLQWVKGHAGDEGNEAADELAERGHSEEGCTWSLQLGPPPGLDWWACWKRQPTHRRPGKMVAQIEHEWVATRLLEQLRVANPEFSIRRREMEVLLKALSWYAVGDGTYVGRRSFAKTSERDSSERSLGLKLLLGNLPVMKRQLAWYSGAYPEEEMGRCPLNHRREAMEQQRETGEHQTRRRREEAPIETMAHYLECYSYSTDPAPAKAKDDSAEESWKYEFRTRRNTFVGVSTWDWEEAERLLARHLRPGQKAKETMVRRLIQTAYRERLHYERARWEYRNDCQIERERDSQTSPEKRRRMMREDGTQTATNREDGVPKWPRTWHDRDDEFRLFSRVEQARVSGG